MTQLFDFFCDCNLVYQFLKPGGEICLLLGVLVRLQVFLVPALGTRGDIVLGKIAISGIHKLSLQQTCLSLLWALWILLRPLSLRMPANDLISATCSH